MTNAEDHRRGWEQLKTAFGEGAPEDPRWRALSDGTLPTEEEAALQAEDPDAYALFRPFTADERERIFAGVRIRMMEGASRRRLARGMIVLVAVAVVLAGVGTWLLLTHGAVAGVGVLLISGPLVVMVLVAYSARHAWHPRDSTTRALLELELERRNDMLRRLVFARVVSAVFVASGLLPFWRMSPAEGRVISVVNAIFRIVFMGWVFWIAGRRYAQVKREREDITAELQAKTVDAKVGDEPVNSTQGPR